MDAKIKIYRDSGANVKFLKPYLYCVTLYQYPYDSIDRPKRQKMELALPSELTWDDAHSTWDESSFTWDDCRGSENHNSITRLVGKPNRRDILHLDSAYKTDCHIFLTSDKNDIHSKRAELELICKFKVFFHHNEQEIIEYILGLMSKNSKCA